MKPRVLVAPDSFKGTFDSDAVAAAISTGLTRAGCVADQCPVGDGGEGTARILTRALGGTTHVATARDPLGRRIEGSFGLAGSIAVVEVAAASGLDLLVAEERDPLRATTHGTGDLIVAARRAGAQTILIAAGGTATVDGGMGALETIAEAGGLPGIGLRVLCDVRTPFEQAAAVFGPQKGASDPAMVRKLAARLERLAAGWPRDPRGHVMTGAAGGLSGGLWAVLGAELVAGSASVLRAVGFGHRLLSADAVVVGEGQLDTSTMHGKIAGEIARRAWPSGLPVHAVVGRSRLSQAQCQHLGFRSLREAGSLSALEAAGQSLGEELVSQTVRRGAIRQSC